MTIDTAARRAITEDLDVTLIVEAAAGTGKTTELVHRILRVLATGRATMIEIVAVTFTEKAAGELKLRLREGPVEAEVDPLFTVMTEPQAARLYSRAFRAWLQEALRNPSEGVRRALRRTSAPSFGGPGSSVSDGPIDRLRNAGRTLAEWRDFAHPWQRPPFDRESEIDRLVAALHDLASLTAAPSSERDNLFADTAAVRRLSRQIRLEASFGGRDLDGWEARLVDLTRDRAFSRARKGSGYKFGRKDGRDVTRTEVLSAHAALLAALQQFRQQADADLAASLQQELAAATTQYQTLKQAAGALDFADLLVRARDLIKNDAGVRAHLQTKFTRIFV